MTLRALFCLSLLSMSPAALASKCSVELEANDAMRFNLSTIEVDRTCADFEIRLRHSGRLPKAAMGHNVVIVKSADLEAVDADGIRAGAAENHVKPGDTRVVAFSPLIGGGETASVRFNPARLDRAAKYAFFCSFPGHSALMKGELKLVP